MAGDLGSLHSLTGDRGAGGKEARRLLLVLLRFEAETGFSLPVLRLLLLRLEAWLVGCELMLVFMLHKLLVILPSKS